MVSEKDSKTHSAVKDIDVHGSDDAITSGSCINRDVQRLGDSLRSLVMNLVKLEFQVLWIEVHLREGRLNPKLTFFRTPRMVGPLFSPTVQT